MSSIRIISPKNYRIVYSRQRGPQGATGETGSAGAAENLVYGETPSGLVNGSNAVFTSQFPFVPESVEVVMNGLTLTRLTDYNTSGNSTITLTFSPASTETIRINYQKV